MVFNTNHLEEFRFTYDFPIGIHNQVLVEGSKINALLIKLLKSFNSSYYVISGFNLKPYLTLSENIYDMLGIDLEIERQNKLIFKDYCKVFDFDKFDKNFHLLSRFDKLKSMFIVSLFSNRKIIVFSNTYSEKFKNYIDYIFEVISKMNLFSDRIFIEIKAS